MSKRLTLSISGVPGVMRTLKGLPKGVRRKGVRIALSAAGGVIKRELVKNTPRETGLLKQSIGVKVIVPKDETRGSVIVGARRGFKRATEKKKRGGIKLVSKKTQALLPPSSETKYRNPTRYSHLVEKKYRFHARSQVTSRGRAMDQMASKLRAAVLAYR